MQYIERLLNRQAQMASRLEEQSTPNLQIYPDGIWLQAESKERSDEELFADGVKVSQEDSAEEIYRQLMRLEAVREQRVQTVYRQMQTDSAVNNRTDAALDTAAYAAADAGASAGTMRRYTFGALPEGRVSLQSMERISRFFERDARRYGG